MLELLVFGTFWFWVLLFVEFCFLIFLLENEKYYTAPLTVFAVIALLAFFGSGSELKDVLVWIVHNPLWTIAYVVGYFVFGALYVSSPYIGKWWWFVRDVRDHNRDTKQQWLGNWRRAIDRIKEELENVADALQRLQPNDTRRQSYVEKGVVLKAELAAFEGCNGVMTEALLPFWKEYEKETYFQDTFGRSVSIAKPTPDNFKSRIASWIVYWPPSLIWTILNDPLRRIGRRIYDGVAGLLKSISDSAWKDEDKLG